MSYGNSFQRTTPIVLNLIIINAIVFFAQMAFGGMQTLNKVNYLFALHHYKSEMFKPHQLVTHMFMHGNLGHIFSNMFALFMFGSILERFWGGQRFFIFYFITVFPCIIIHCAKNLGRLSYEASQNEFCCCCCIFYVNLNFLI